MRFGAFGDMLLLLPMLNWLAARAQAQVDVVSSGGWTRPLLGLVPAVGAEQLLSSRKAPYVFNRSQQELVGWLRSQRGRPLLICETDDKSRWLARRAGWAESDMLWAGDDAERPDEPWVERWLRLAHAAYGAPFDRGQVPGLIRELGWIDPGAAAHADCAQWLAAQGWADDPLILLQPGNKRTMGRRAEARASNPKFWPDAHWAELCRQLLARQPQARVLICGSPAEQDYCARLAALSGQPRVHAVADALPIPRLLALLARAAGMLSVDTGPAHAAAAMNCPLVVLFSNKDPALWQPYAVDAPVHSLRAPGGRMDALGVDAVLAAWAQLPAGPAA